MLKLTNVKKHYQQFTLDCSLEVKSGCITGLIGQNGAGKSTTFKAILNLIQKDSGVIELFGKDLQKLDKKDKEKIGVVLSDSGFSGYLTIGDIVPVLSNLYKKFNKVKFLERSIWIAKRQKNQRIFNRNASKIKGSGGSVT